MKIFQPEYYARFRCAAGACPDSCCQEWEVDIDEGSAARYRRLSGPIGDRLREFLREGEGGAYLALDAGRCPMWQEDGLCRLQRELGEGELCRVCREFPRLQHDYGDFLERGLELSCPEAAKYILSALAAPLLQWEEPGAGEAEYDREAMALLLTTREEMRAILSEESRPFGECLALGLLYGCQVQSALDGGELPPFRREAALESTRGWAQPGDMGEILEFFSGLEILTDRWRERLAHPAPAPWEEGHRALARYFLDRYWLQAVSDYDIYSRCKLLLIACLTVRHLGGDLTQTAQLFSKEIENDPDNLDALLDAAYESPAFRDANLLGLTFSGQV